RKNKVAKSSLVVRRWSLAGRRDNWVAPPVPLFLQGGLLFLGLNSYSPCRSKRQEWSTAVLMCRYSKLPPCRKNQHSECQPRISVTLAHSSNIFPDVDDLQRSEERGVGN